MRAMIAAMLAVLCVAGASMARGDDGPTGTPTSETIFAAAAAAQQAAHLPQDADRCSPDSIDGRPS